MNPVKKMSIGGYAFTIENKAVEYLEQYLSNLREHYQSVEGGSEIMEGIEERMAELLLERCGRTGVVTESDASAVKSTLGNPEAIDAESNTENGSDSGDSGLNPPKKLFRDIENGKILGVCSGLGAYFNIDVVIIRAVAVAITIVIWAAGGVRSGIGFLSPVIAYLILGFITPAAKTVQDRHRMKGEGNTVNDIQKTVQESFKEASGAIRDFGNSETVRNAGNALMKTAGFLLFIIGVGGLFCGCVMIFWHRLFGFDLISARLLDEIVRNIPRLYAMYRILWVQCLLGAVYFLPFIGMIYGSLQMIVGFKSPKWHPGLIIFIVWLTAITMIAVLAMLASANMY
ncbi:MAG: PspC domain-containing protein [Candidatus Cryptobacteroides sp.]